MKTTKVTESVKKTGTDIKTAYKNGTRLIESTALIVVAGFAIYSTLPSKHSVTVNSGALLVSGLIIAMRAAVEFFRYLAQK